MSCVGVAQVKIESKDYKMLHNAFVNFGSKRDSEVRDIALETMEGHQRAIIGTMTVEEVFQDRLTFAKQVFEVASVDMMSMGLTVISYTLKDVSDPGGYLAAFGMGRTAEVKRDATIGQAVAKMESDIKESIAHEKRMMAQFANDSKTAKAKRDFDLRKAENDKEVLTKKAVSDLAKQLQQAKTRQEVKKEEMQVKIVARTRQIELQEQEILRRENELEAQVKKPAEAMKYQMEVNAQAEMEKIVLEAEAEAEAVKVKGEAEAFAITEKAKANFQAMKKKAEGWKQYQDAALVDMVLQALPKVAAEISAPISNANKITMISTGSGDIGASKLTGEILDVMGRLPVMIEQMTGVKMSDALKKKH